MKELYTSIEADNHWDETVEKCREKLRLRIQDHHNHNRRNEDTLMAR